MPYPPTAHPNCGETNLTSYKISWASSVLCRTQFCCVQVWPPSSVCQIAPHAPTAQPDCGVANVIAVSREPRVCSFCHMRSHATNTTTATTARAILVRNETPERRRNEFSRNDGGAEVSSHCSGSTTREAVEVSSSRDSCLHGRFGLLFDLRP